MDHSASAVVLVNDMNVKNLTSVF